MNTDLCTILRRAISIAVIGALGAPHMLMAASPQQMEKISATEPPADRAADAAPSAPSAPGEGLRPAERSFLEKATELSLAQLRLAQLGVSRAASSELRALAQQLVADYRQISESVDDLRKRKGGATTPANQARSDAYKSLSETSGTEFDRAFVRLISAIQTDAMALFERATGEVTDAEVRELAGASLPALREHQNRLTELKKDFG